MSYILEALKKSETERRSGAVPGLASGASYVVSADQRPARLGTVLLAGGAMLACGLALGWWQPWAAQASSPKAAPAEALPALAGAGPQPAQAAPAPAASPEKAPPAVAAPRDARAQTHEARPRPAEAKPQSGDAEKRAVKRAAVRPVVAAKPAEAVKEVRAEETPVDRILAYKELPAAVQGGLPKVSFGGYAGADGIDGRIALINNRLVKEGEEISPGLKLERVDPEGVVLGYKGYRYRP